MLELREEKYNRASFCWRLYKSDQNDPACWCAIPSSVRRPMSGCRAGRPGQLSWPERRDSIRPRVYARSRGVLLRVWLDRGSRYSISMSASRGRALTSVRSDRRCWFLSASLPASKARPGRPPPPEGLECRHCCAAPRERDWRGPYGAGHD
jgi:hypothetical protein